MSSIDLASTTSQSTVSVEWKSISVYAKNEDATAFTKSSRNASRKKQILKDISGRTNGGMTAIMGASGCGKTTLLNTLSSWISRKYSWSGKVMVDGCHVDMKSISAFVQQSDVFYEYLTLYEHLIYQARLRLGAEMNDSQIRERVDWLIEHFGLSRAEHNMIGNYEGNRKGISIGERRRLSIVTELLRMPRILFCDEPTSGLDLYAAETTVAALQKISKFGCTVICSIHQPTFFIYKQFENLLLIADGRNVYMGSLDDAVKHFENAGLKCPPRISPPDFYIKTVAIIRGNEQECIERISKLEKLQKDNYTPTKSSDKSFSDSSEKRSQFYTGFFYQFKTIIERDFSLNLRDYKTIIFRFIQNLVFSVLLGIVYYKLPYNNEWLFSNGGIILFLIGAISYSVVVAVVYTFPLHLDVFRREHRAGLYRTSLFLISKWISEVPVFSLIVLMDLLIVYNMGGLNPDPKAFYLIYTIFWLSVQGSLCFAFFLSVIAKDVTMAITLGGPVSVLLCIIGGFLITESEMTWVVRWIRYLSWVRYSYEAATLTHFGSRSMRCSGFLCFTDYVDINKVAVLVQADANFIKYDFVGMCILPIGYMIVAVLILWGKTYYSER